MGGQYGTKNTEELLYAVKVAVLAVVREAQKDGWQPKDLGAFLKSPEFEAALAPALSDVGVVGNELMEVDFFDGLRLARYCYGIMDEVLDELKSGVKK
jgi:hypothetical protein